MILPRHPDLMSDQELGQWVLNLVKLKEPESIFLDYKETISTQSPSDKREIAKDISSFANERGGIVLYGISEVKVDGVPIPMDVQNVGMDPAPDLLEKVENILVDTLTPRLPELRIRMVPLPNSPEKVVYLVWHPESWEAPHMIHSYNEHRFYKRGNFRAVPMEEGEVERLYLRRQSRRALAERFFQEADFGESLLPADQVLGRLVVCPALPFANRTDFSHKGMRDWLTANLLGAGLGWFPFIEGVRFSRPLGDRNQYTAEYRLFRNGAASSCSNYVMLEKKMISGLKLCRWLDKFLCFVGKFYQQIGMAGDVLVDVTLSNMEEVRFVTGIGGLFRRADLDYRWHSSILQFRVAAGAVDLIADDNRHVLERRMMDRFVQCFGEWSIPEYFKDGTPV